MRGMGASRNVKNKFNKKHDAFFTPFSLMYSNVGTEILGNEEKKHRNGDETSDKPLACDIRHDLMRKKLVYDQIPVQRVRVATYITGRCVYGTRHLSPLYL